MERIRFIKKKKDDNKEDCYGKLGLKIEEDGDQKKKKRKRKGHEINKLLKDL